MQLSLIALVDLYAHYKYVGHAPATYPLAVPHTICSAVQSAAGAI